MARALDDTCYSGGNIPSNGSKADSLSLLVCLTDVAHRSTIHRIRARRQAEEEDPEAVDVAADCGGAALEDFRCQVQRSAREVVLGVIVELPSSAKVHQHDAPGLLADDVVGFDVAMQQAR